MDVLTLKKAQKYTDTLRDSLVPIENLVKNGTFEKGTTGWSFISVTPSVGDKEITCIATNQNGRIQQQLFYDNRDVIYRGAFVKATSRSVGLGESGWLAKPHSGSGQYEWLSYISASTTKYISIIDTRTSGWDSFSAKSLIAINLTKTFGAGNEPTLKEMDAFMTGYTDNWFDGTVSGINGIVSSISGKLAEQANLIYNVKDSIHSKRHFIYNWEHGTLSSIDGSDINIRTRIRSEFIRVDKGTFIESLHPDIQVTHHRYTLDKTWVAGSGPWSVNNIITEDSYIRIVVRYTDDRVIENFNEIIDKIRLTVPDGSNDLYIPYDNPRNLLYKIPGTLGQSITFVGDELWGFIANSTGDRTTYGTAYRYAIDYENETATLLGTFQHNWGHCNTLDYCPETDTIILGNGSGLAEEPYLNKEIYILPNASSFKNMSTVPVESNGIILDVTALGWGRQLQVIWGEDNNRKYNICYCLSNDGTALDDTSKERSNLYIRRILLGQGSNRLPNGTFISGKTGLEFNGTFKVLAVYKGEDVYSPYECTQDADFYKGKIYTGLGHDGIYISEITLRENGVLEYAKKRERYWVDDDGSNIQTITQAMTIKDGMLHVRVWEGKNQSVALCVYEI